MYYYWDFYDNYISFNSLNEAITNARKQGVGKVRDTEGGEYYAM